MSRTIKRIIGRLYLTTVCLYLLSPFGATFHGVNVPDYQMLTLGLTLVTVLIWLVMRFRNGWHWYRSVLDAILPLWILAISVSTFANPEVYHRSRIAIWFVLAYIAFWYLLHDVLANRAVKQAVLVDALLCAGSVMMIFSAIQIVHTGNPLQPVSIMGNSNALGTVLLVVLAFAIWRLSRSKERWTRIAWAIYSFGALANLALTLSRGAWIGFIGEVAILILLLLAHYGALSRKSVRTYWLQKSQAWRRSIAGGCVIATLVVVAALALILNSFSIKERRAALRTAPWHSALIQFANSPVAGSGLFGFGKDNGLYMSIPPAQGFSHAHSVPFNVAAELGLLGLVALLATVLTVLRHFRRNWATLDMDDRLLRIFAMSALTGYATHHLFDVTAMMPAVALVGLLVLALAAAPKHEKPVTTRRLARAPIIGLTLLWLLLLVAAARNSDINRRYLDALRLASAKELHEPVSDASDDYLAAIEMLDELIASDPQMPVYHQQHAMLLGLLASRVDVSWLEPAIQSFQRFLEIESNHAISWANLAALQWMAGDSAAAIYSIERASSLAPKFALFASNLALYRAGIFRPPQEVPENRYNQEFTRYEFLREALPMTFLPQVSMVSQFQ